MTRGDDRARTPKPENMPIQRAVAQLQRLVGNTAVSRALKVGQTSSRIAVVASDAAPGRVDLLPSTARIPEPAAVQRADPTAPTVPTTPFTLGGITIATYSDAASAFRFWCTEVAEESDVMVKGGMAVPAALGDVRMRGLDYADILEGGEEEPLDHQIADDMRSWHAEFLKAIASSRQAQAWEASRRAKAAADDLRDANAQLEALLPTLRDVQRAKFRGGDEDGLLETADAIATILDTALVTKTAIEETLNVAAELRLLGGLPSPSKAAMTARVTMTLEALEKINKAWAAFQLVRTVVDLISDSKTDSEGARKGVAGMATVMSAGGTLLNASVGFTLYSNLYIGPMTSTCLKMLSRLEDLVSKSTNRTWIELGEFEYVNWSLEPGGRKMFDFVLRVMRASGPADVPGPTGDVDDYFVDHQDEFNAGVGKSGGELPTEGMWFWEDTNAGEFKHWAYKNRDHLWGMLYGAAKVPSV